jgi:hypothetical protein
MRLSALRLPFLRSVIAGLDPAIHAEERLDRSTGRSFETAVSMDRRVKPGGDETFGKRIARTNARVPMFDIVDRNKSRAWRDVSRRASHP